MKNFFISEVCFITLAIGILTLHSCNNEIESIVLPEENETIEARNDSIMATTRGSGSQIVKDPALEWWHDKEGSLSDIYMPFVYMESEPSSSMTLNEFSQYIIINWTGYAPYNRDTHNQYKMQVQYRKAYYYPLISEPWEYPKPDTDKFGWRIYGFYDLLDYQENIDISAAAFPYGYMEVRVRLVQKDFPGDNIGTEKEPLYDLNLATEWGKVHDPQFNNYGFGRPQPEPRGEEGSSCPVCSNCAGWENENAQDDGIINVQVFLPTNTSNIQYSYTVSTGIEDVPGNLKSGHGNNTFSKWKSTGQVTVFANQTIKADYGSDVINTYIETYAYGWDESSIMIFIGEEDFVL